LPATIGRLFFFGLYSKSKMLRRSIERMKPAKKMESPEEMTAIEDLFEQSEKENRRQECITKSA